jgi:FKBP-type peptidyl-prolyl cis-trans isomerase (trigger factor)
MKDQHRPTSNRPERELKKMEERQAKLHTELDDVYNTTAARRVRIDIVLDRLASEERRIRGAVS